LLRRFRREPLIFFYSNVACEWIAIAHDRATGLGVIVMPLAEKTALHALCESEFIRAISGKGLQPEALSDCIRIELLRRYGGAWADVTTYCLKPLDDWLSGHYASRRRERHRYLA
jgi:Capsular polysaccharide synthesis protein